VTHRPRGRQQSRNSWSALLAVLLGALASASTFALSTSFAGGLSIAGHSADTRNTSNPATVRPDRVDASLNVGGLDDPTVALAPHHTEAEVWISGFDIVQPVALALPADIARTRDGRTRAPPHA
jgi:hypothetical protein